MSENAQLQATAAVNELLGTLLPGAKKISVSDGGRSQGRGSHRGSKAKLIDRNLKRMVELRERDEVALKKRQKKKKIRAIKCSRASREEIEQAAKLRVLEEHRKRGNLSAKERKYLNKLAERNARNVDAWELEDEEKEELRELQQRIIGQISADRPTRGQARRKKIKTFKEEIKPVADRRYPGLTPGLAPVGLSDEEESSDED
ncbi:hypothetical protein HG536_0B02920 [Torulaspora globosa]|uniref:Regulator of rDNA transcription 14 n=1 Tax=Torulaspora globosa TaxID=48254 RepID=A0A7G3ZD43_9SACH|nr:uncharacterized protein HG536_0B02920 [Torulaspora globosa]QLL31429.1 hypothetical protein HG536_0B02920 [Torulaspora globosa]